jgi:predicted nucleotidyltransferase
VAVEVEGSIRQAVAAAAATHPALRLLVLYGSRARGDAGASSDWDFGYLADRGFDGLALTADLVRLLGTDRVDLVDLARASAQLRYRAAREGRCLHERERRAFDRFWLDAVSFWCDARGLIRAGYADVLRGLER